jgi:hypothetical protein
MDEEDNDGLDLLVHKAILNARKAFNKTFEDEDLDPSYWAINLKAYVLSSDEFKPLKIIKDDVYPYMYVDESK